MSFVAKHVVRCDDCETRADLTNAGHPAPETKGRIRRCGGCGGRPAIDMVSRIQEDGSTRQEPVPVWGHVQSESKIDPYAIKVDAADPYVAKRAERAARARIDHAPRRLRRAFLDRARIEALMGPYVPEGV